MIEKLLKVTNMEETTNLPTPELNEPDGTSHQHVDVIDIKKIRNLIETW